MTTSTRFLSSGPAFILLLGCREVPAPPAAADPGARIAAWIPDSAATLAHEFYSGFTDATLLLVVDVPTWTSAWARLYATREPQPELPTVDFRAEAVLVAGLGERANGGFDIRIDSVVGYERGTSVYVTTTAPGPSCFTTQALRLGFSSRLLSRREGSCVSARSSRPAA
jgi:hypothetical protein